MLGQHHLHHRGRSHRRHPQRADPATRSSAGENIRLRVRSHRWRRLRLLLQRRRQVVLLRSGSVGLACMILDGQQTENGLTPAHPLPGATTLGALSAVSFRMVAAYALDGCAHPVRCALATRLERRQVPGQPVADPSMASTNPGCPSTTTSTGNPTDQSGLLWTPTRASGARRAAHYPGPGGARSSMTSILNSDSHVQVIGDHGTSNRSLRRSNGRLDHRTRGGTDRTCRYLLWEEARSTPRGRALSCRP